MTDERPHRPQGDTHQPESYELRTSWTWKMAAVLLPVSCVLALAGAALLVKLIPALGPDQVLLPTTIALAVGLVGAGAHLVRPGVWLRIDVNGVWLRGVKRRLRLVPWSEIEACVVWGSRGRRFLGVSTSPEYRAGLPEASGRLANGFNKGMAVPVYGTFIGWSGPEDDVQAFVAAMTSWAPDTPVIDPRRRAHPSTAD